MAQFVRVMWASVDGAAFGGVAEGGAGVGAGDARRVVGDVLVVGARGSRSQVVNRAMPPVRLVQVVSVTVRLMPLLRAVCLSCQASVALVALMVVCWRFVPVVVLRWPGALGGAPRCRVISLPLLAEGAAGVAAGEGGGCDGVVVVVGAARGGC